MLNGLGHDSGLMSMETLIVGIGVGVGVGGIGVGVAVGVGVGGVGGGVDPAVPEPASFVLDGGHERRGSALASMLGGDQERCSARAASASEANGRP